MVVRFAVIDNYPLFVEGIIRTLESQAGFQMVAKGATSADAVRIAREAEPDILLLDSAIVGSGPGALRGIADAGPGVKVLMLTVSADPELAMAALQSGARGYLTKNVSGAELVRAVRSVNEGERYVSPGLAARLLSKNVAQSRRRDRRDDLLRYLSIRENQVLACIRNGMSNKEIGSKLRLSEKTVKHHVTSLLQKLQVKNRVQAALLISNLAQESVSNFTQTSGAVAGLFA